MKKLMRIIATLLLSCIFLIVGMKEEAVAAPPTNFQLETMVAAGLDGPSGFEIAPDGRIFVLERTGKIKIIKNGVLLDEPFADLPSAASGDRGLIGIAFDPEFNITNHYVYFYYTGLDKLNRLVRFDASGDIGTNGPFLLYKTSSPSEELHVGGSIRFGADGKLYFAVGDNGYPPNAQNLGNPHGKILRINKDGSIPLDNPFYGQAGALPEIWAYGMRNPWRFQFDSATGMLYGGDVGDFTWEEVNHIEKGKNYGWPTHEGFCNTLCGTTVSPIYAYNHDNESAAVTGGPVYRGDMFPAEYNGAYFFGDYAKGFIKYISLDANGNSTGVHDFDLNAGSVVDLKVAPDGSMYYITYWPGILYRLTYTTGNHKPTANATADNEKGVEPFTVHFSSAGSSDPDGDPLTFAWKFGDGTTSTEANPVKTYTIKGTYAVELTVSDGVNTAKAVPVVIQVGIPPTINIGEPADGSTYKANDTIHFTVSSLDGAGFDIDDRNLSTEILLHHGTHIHPFAGPIIGRQGDFHIPTTGEASADTWFEIKATAKDTNGLSSTKSVFIYPIKSTFTIATQPEGMTVFLDGVPRTTPSTIQGVVNFKRELNVPTTQILNGKQYQFVGWSDGQPQKHFIEVKDAPATYTAIYEEATAWNGEYFNNGDLAGAPALVRQDSILNFNWGDGVPDPAITNGDFFSVRWTKNQAFVAGKYKFSASTDDGFRLYIDDQLIMDNWTAGVITDSEVVTLTGGMHALRFEFREGGGGAYAQLDYDMTPDQPVLQPTGYTAEYFNNMTLTGVPTLTRTDAAIDFVWDGTSPDPVITADNFSARWTKATAFESGTYEFTVTGDDGVRVFIDNELIVDGWKDQGMTTYTGTKALAAGNHTIRVEYYDNNGGAVVKFNYVKLNDTPPPPPAGGFSAEYFNNLTLTGMPALIRTDAAVFFEWDGGSPDPLINPDAFSARWTKTENFAAGTYEFSTTTDDGVKLYVDGELLINKWIDQGSTTYRASKTLTAGDHTIVMEYYENGGGAVAKLNYAQTDVPPPPPSSSFTGEYFNNTELIGPVVMTRADAAINFDWAGGSPDPLINANNFSVRWTKTDVFEEGIYEFTTTSDDGIRVKVDGEILIDKFIDQGATTYKATKALTAGNHTVVIEYYEAGGGAMVQASYVKVGGTTPPPPSEKYQAKYWNLIAPASAPLIPAGPPNLTREDATIDFAWNDDPVAPGINPNGYIAQWVKTHVFEAGTYKFTTQSDDGIRVYIDDEIVIDQWNDHGLTTHTGNKTLTSGEHVIRVEYYENTGGAVAKFNFEKVITPDPDPNPGPTEGFNVEFFNNMTLTGTPILTKVYAAINFILEGSSPDPLVNADGFSARATKTKQYAAGTYNFTIKSDDGVRFYIDDVLIVDDWSDHAMTTHNPSVVLTEGQHTLRIEYYENNGGAIFIFEEN